MLARNCKACVHFKNSDQAIGTCRRFPTFQTRSPYEWCGEFASLEKPEMLALPVVDMPEEKPKRKYTRREKP